MADKKGQKKDVKAVEKWQKTPDQSPSFKTKLSDVYLDKIKESFTGFNKISHEERMDLYGDKKFLDQFRLYFKEQHPNLLDQINRQDMPIYLQTLEKRWFSIWNILQDAETLREEFKADDTEEHVIKASLKTFKSFCGDSINNIPADVFDDFAKHAWFDTDDFEIDPDGRIKTIDNLYDVWKRFVEKKNLTLKELQSNNIEKILNPEFNPIERCMVNVALKKLRKELTWPVRIAFDAKFGTEVTIFSRVQNLVAFKNEWLVFLGDHTGEIDEKLAKTLDGIMVSNGEIKNELTKSWRKFDDTKWFSEWEQYFRVIFNKLATRQLFEEIKADQKTIDYYADTIVDAMKWFPPYVNEIFKLYPFDTNLDPQLSGKLWAIDTKIGETENKIAEWTPDETKILLRAEIKTLKEQREKIRWDAYATQLDMKDKSLAGAIRTLVDSKFDFSQLHMGQQQALLDVLVKHKLEDIIKRKAPELLSTDEDELKTFLDDLFDLRKTDVSIPTSDGRVHIKFSSDGKKFLWTGMTNLASFEELSKLENLPLNFEVQVTPSSEKFFEESIIFHSIFDEFAASNGTKKLNDAYKVSVTKDGKTVVWYLSLYSPIEKEKQWKPDAGSSAVNRYLYSSPVTTASDDRSLVTRDGTENGIAVVIPESEEKNCKIEVLERKINLNGEALWALFAWFVLGQQSLERTLSPAEEEQRRQKMAKLKTFQDINQDVTDSEQKQLSNEPWLWEKKESAEKSDIDKFLEEWKKLKWYKFTGAEHEWFKEGAKFIIKCGSTWLPPDETWWDAWMWLEVANVDRNAGKFTVKVRSGETKLGSLEWAKKTLPMNDKTIDNIVEALWDIDKKIYKMPSGKGTGMEWLISLMKSSGFDNSIFASAFDKISWTWNGFKISVGEKFVWEDVEYFWYDEKEYYTGNVDRPWKTEEMVNPIYYKAKYNANGTVTVTNNTELKDTKTRKPFTYNQTMDYAMFVLFVWSKKLHPKPKSDISAKAKIKFGGEDEWHKLRQPFFSINNVVWFFKSWFSKIIDGIKKHDEERVEDLMDIALQNWLLFEKLGKGIGTIFDRVGNGMERAGMEYYTARDNRVWKKIERWQKIYEADAHFSSLFPRKIKDLVNGKDRPKDMYKIPALLLAIINKEKTPYSRSYEYIGKWHRVNLILGKKHQQRYLDRLNWALEDIRQNSDLYGVDWTIYRNEAMVKLEMKYLVDVIDGREHNVWWEHEKLQAAKWSREFANKLDESMKKNFWFSAIETKHKELSKTTRFEFAEYEYQRHMRNWRTMSSFPFFKMMAETAQSPKQRNLFYMYVVSWILSWYFWYNTDATTKWWLKDICRTSWCLGWLMAKDPGQQAKMLKLLDIYTQGKFSKEFQYNKTGNPKKLKLAKFDLNDFTMGKMESVWAFIRWWRPSFKTRWLDDENGEWFAKFLSFESDNSSEKKNGKTRWTQKTIVELANDPTVEHDDKTLLEAYVKFAQEKSEDIDLDIRHNISAMYSRPFAKSETIVKILMEYENGEFKGKDSHEQGGSAMFWDKVRALVPQKKTDWANVEFILKKFLNRFGRVGFEGNERSEFVKRLVAIREMLEDTKTKAQAEHTLWYTINGTIIKNNSWGRDVPPEAFLNALDAFKMFFKVNIDTILDPSMIGSVMWSQYVDDLKPGLVKVWDREEYISHKDAAFGFGLQLDAKDKFTAVRNKYEKGSKYINKELYQVAEELEKRHGVHNALDDYLNSDTQLNVQHTDARADLVTNFWPWWWSGSKNKGVRVKNLNTIQWWLAENLWSDVASNRKTPIDNTDDEIATYHGQTW